MEANGGGHIEGKSRRYRDIRKVGGWGSIAEKRKRGKKGGMRAIGTAGEKWGR